MIKTSWRYLGCRMQEGTWVYDEALAAHDLQAVERIHQQQIEKYGKQLVGDLPKLNESPVWVALVAERAGAIVDFGYAETVLEWCTGGIDTRATASLRRHAPALLQRFQKQGFRGIRTFIPRAGLKTIGKQAERIGFTPQDEFYAHYLCDLRGKQR